MMQEYCRVLGISTSAKELRDLGAALEALPADHPISGVMRRAKDFRRPEAMADALLNPRDRAYAVPELYAWLDRCGISFGRWIEQAPYLAQCGMVARSPHAAHLASLPSRLQHAAVELFRGTMVSHSFVAYRDDRVEEGQPVNFAGDRWRNYVPIPLPWTMRIRERLPPGSVAVLISGSHTFADLVLPIDSFEDHLLSAVNGTRTLSEILPFAGGDKDSERRAVAFFERLWRHDQVVIDASRAGTSCLDEEESSGVAGQVDRGLAWWKLDRESSMREWLTFLTEYAVETINLMALLVIAIGTVEMFLRCLLALLHPSTTRQDLRDGYLRFARWLIGGLTFQLAADIIETASAPTWDDIGRLTAIAVVRTFLNYFLERDIANSRNEISALRDESAKPNK